MNRSALTESWGQANWMKTCRDALLYPEDMRSIALHPIVCLARMAVQERLDVQETPQRTAS